MKVVVANHFIYADFKYCKLILHFIKEYNPKYLKNNGDIFSICF